MKTETPEELAGRVTRAIVDRLRGEADALNALADLMAAELGHLPGVGAGGPQEQPAAPEAAPGVVVFEGSEQGNRQRELAKKMAGEPYRLVLEKEGDSYVLLEQSETGARRPAKGEMAEFIDGFDERLIGPEFVAAVNRAAAEDMILDSRTAIVVQDWTRQAIEKREADGG